MQITGMRKCGVWEIVIICTCGFEHIHFQDSPKLKSFKCPACGEKIKNYDTTKNQKPATN